jgi:hypothetical protein
MEVWCCIVEQGAPAAIVVHHDPSILHVESHPSHRGELSEQQQSGCIGIGTGTHHHHHSDLAAIADGQVTIGCAVQQSRVCGKSEQSERSN